MRVLKNLLTLFVCLYALPQIAVAALPPAAQNGDDIDSMLDFARAHPAIISNINSIHVFDHIESADAHDNETEIPDMPYPYGMIVYNLDDKNCRAYFIRGESTFDGPGPAPDLVFSRSTCPIDY